MDELGNRRGGAIPGPAQLADLASDRVGDDPPQHRIQATELHRIHMQPETATRPLPLNGNGYCRGAVELIGSAGLLGWQWSGCCRRSRHDASRAVVTTAEASEEFGAGLAAVLPVDGTVADLNELNYRRSGAIPGAAQLVHLAGDRVGDDPPQHRVRAAELHRVLIQPETAARLLPLNGNDYCRGAGGVER